MKQSRERFCWQEKILMKNNVRILFAQVIIKIREASEMKKKDYKDRDAFDFPFNNIDE